MTTTDEPGGDGRCVEHCADAGEHRAPEERGVLERDGAAEGQRDLLRDHDPLGEAAGRGAAIDRLPAVRHAGRPVGEGPVRDRGVEPLARCGTTTAAARALAARGRPREHDVVAGSDLRDRLADRLDDPRPLVPEHHRRRPSELPLHLVEIRATDADGGHPDDDLVRPRLVEVELDDLERLADAVEEGGARLQSSTSAVVHRSRAAAKRPHAGILAREGSARADPVRIHSRIRRLQIKRAPP